MDRIVHNRPPGAVAIYTHTIRVPDQLHCPRRETPIPLSKAQWHATKATFSPQSASPSTMRTSRNVVNSGKLMHTLREQDQ